MFGRNPRIKNDYMDGWMSDGSSIGEPEVTEGAGPNPVSRPNFNEKAKSQMKEKVWGF